MKSIYCIAFFLVVFTKAFPQSQYHLFEIANCNGETRTALYGTQLSQVMFALKGAVKFKGNNFLKFSSNNTANPDSLENKAIQFRKTLPKNFWDNGVAQTRLDTKPNEDGKIWFEKLYVQIVNKNEIKIFAACKVLIEGTDPEKERINPKIQDNKITLDKNALKKYNPLIKKLMAANNIAPIVPQKANNGMDEQPPVVEKLEN